MKQLGYLAQLQNQFFLGWALLSLNTIPSWGIEKGQRKIHGYRTQFLIINPMVVFPLSKDLSHLHSTTSKWERHYNIMESALAFQSEDLGQSPLNTALWVRHLTNLILFLVFKIIVIIYLFYVFHRASLKINWLLKNVTKCFCNVTNVLTNFITSTIKMQDNITDNNLERKPDNKACKSLICLCNIWNKAYKY